VSYSCFPPVRSFVCFLHKTQTGAITMLFFDGDCDVVSLNNSGPTDDVLNSLDAAHVLLRQDGLMVREHLITRTLRTVRLTKGGGLFICKDDDIIVQSLDMRSVAHIVPLVLTKGTLVSSQPNLLGVPQTWQQQLHNVSTAMMSRPVMEETVVRTALAMVWPRRLGEPLASLVRGDMSDKESMRNGSFYGSVRGGNSSTSSIPSPTSPSQPPVTTSPLLQAVKGPAQVAATRASLLEATEMLESTFPLQSPERGRRVSDRSFVIDFLTRKQALKFFEAVHSILEHHQLPLTLPPEPRFVQPTHPAGTLGTLADNLPPSTGVRRRRRLMSVMGSSPVHGGDGEGNDSDSSDGGDDGTSNHSSGRAGSSSDDDAGQGGRAGDKAATEASTHLRDMFERDDEGYDEEREAELDKRRRMRDEPMSDKATLDVMPEDNLKKMSTAVAQEMIERLTAMKVVLKSPFHLTSAFVENSAAQQEERRILKLNSVSMINTQFPAMLGDSASGGGGDGDDLQSPEPSSLEILTFQRLERSKHPVPVLEALRARKPEYFTKDGAVEFFQLCRDLYRKEREVLSQRTLSLGMLRREGFDSMRYFTGPALQGLFQSWALQRRREGYQLQQYLVELTQYLWFLKRCEAAETIGTTSSSRGGGVVDNQYATTHDVNLHGDDGPPADLRSPDDDGAADEGMSSRYPSHDQSQQQEMGNPLALYTTSASMREQLEHCRLLHVEMELLLAQRKARYEAAGIVDPLFDTNDSGRLVGSSDGMSTVRSVGYQRRNRSNVFPDQVAERLGAASIIAASTAATKATSISPSIVVL
jgi:hypothetical protein